MTIREANMPNGELLTLAATLIGAEPEDVMAVTMLVGTHKHLEGGECDASVDVLTTIMSPLAVIDFLNDGIRTTVRGIADEIDDDLEITNDDK